MGEATASLRRADRAPVTGPSYRGRGACPAYCVGAIVAAMTSTAPHDGIVDLLGVVAYLELMAFSQLAADAGMAPSQPERAAVAKLAVAQFGHYETIVGRLESIGADPEGAMAPFVAAIDEFHRRTRPRDWFEGLVKAYVGDGVAQDFYTEVARFVDPQTRDVVVEVLSNTVHAEVVIPTVREAISADPALAGRLALWGRRLVGEMLTEAQRIGVEREGLTALLVGGVDGAGADLAEFGRMLARITDEHTRRMERLGLSA